MKDMRDTMLRGTVKAVCTSAVRGTAKAPAERIALVAGHGIEGDAHAGRWHRQVSLLSCEKVSAFNRRGGDASDGDFGENVLVEGLDLSRLPVGTTLHAGTAVLRLTQIGKDCHSQCEIFRRVGDCIMPREGVFAEVLEGGELRPGDAIEARLPDADRPFTAAVITLSDRGYSGERADESGPAARDMLVAAGYEVVQTLLLPDDPERLKAALRRLSDQRQVSLIVTSGGTGFTPRDRTPEATLAVAERNAPGVAEYIRMRSMALTPRAMLGRGASVIRGTTLIVNLPGSPRAVRESLGFILDALGHGLKLLRGEGAECARAPGGEGEPPA